MIFLPWNASVNPAFLLVCSKICLSFSLWFSFSIFKAEMVTSPSLSLSPSPSLYISAGELNGCNILPLTWKHRSHPGNDGHFCPRLAKSFHKDYILFLDPIDPESLWLWSHPVLTIFYSELVFNNQSFFPWYLWM